MQSPRDLLQTCRLYGILDLGYVSCDDALDTARHLLDGGINILQLRAKKHDRETIGRLARQLAILCRSSHCLFIVNDYPDIAQESGADGVHIGQDTPDLAAVRRLLGTGKIIGRSTHSPEQAFRGFEEGADYIGFGPLFPTPTKPGRPAIGLADIDRVQTKLSNNFPVFCIGGINGQTLPHVLQAGAKRVVIVSWLLQQANIAQATREIIRQIETSSPLEARIH